MVRLVSKVLTHVCRSLNKQQVTALINRLPGIFQPLLYKETMAPVQQVPLAHLDELVESIYEEDRNSEHPQFQTEVQALNAVVVILRKLDKYLNIFSYNILKPKWVEGLRQIPLEDAA
jgi:predicted mannosyl-3-phosphoglycerate phosphatase (HAD superfamily)